MVMNRYFKRSPQSQKEPWERRIPPEEAYLWQQNRQVFNVKIVKLRAAFGNYTVLDLVFLD